MMGNSREKWAASGAFEREIGGGAGLPLPCPAHAPGARRFAHTSDTAQETRTMKQIFLPLSLLALAACTSTGSDAPKAEKQPTPDEMMAAMTKAGTPTAEHKALQPFVGTWDAKVTMWMDPKAPPMESTGTMVNSWIYDGRYLEQKFVGDMGGMKFEGTGLWGFDVAAGKYVATWYDSMSTGIMRSWGPKSKDGKTFVTTAVNTDPMTGKEALGEEVVTLDSATQHTMTMYEMRGEQKVKTMQIVYTRKP